MKASPAEQKKLLELQHIDTTLAQLSHRENNLPEQSALSQARDEQLQVSARLATETGDREDAEAELARLESDAATVADRQRRDEQRLQQTTSVKDVRALEAELESLRQRTSRLEDDQLEAMERVEQARASENAVSSENSTLTERISDLTAQKERALDEIASQRGEANGRRVSAADALDDALIDIYEHQRAKTGFGAALFRAGACGACTMTLTGRDLATVRDAAMDDIVQCPECDCIVVRTEESGLW